MNGRKLSVNKACLFLAVLLLVAMGTVSAALYGLTQNITAVWYVVLFGIFVLLCAVCFMVLVRRKLAMFSDSFCSLIDNMLSGNMQPKQIIEEESLFYKIEYRLNRLYEVMQENKNSIAQERADLQELISDRTTCFFISTHVEITCSYCSFAGFSIKSLKNGTLSSKPYLMTSAQPQRYSRSGSVSNTSQSQTTSDGCQKAPA